MVVPRDYASFCCYATFIQGNAKHVINAAIFNDPNMRLNMDN